MKKKQTTSNNKCFLDPTTWPCPSGQVFYHGTVSSCQRSALTFTPSGAFVLKLPAQPYRPAAAVPPLMPPLLNEGSRGEKPKSVWELSQQSQRRRRQLSALLTWRLRDANERDSCSFYTSKACVFTGATFNDGDFGASVKGFTASRHRNLVFSWIVFFSLIAFEVCLPNDEVLLFFWPILT